MRKSLLLIACVLVAACGQTGPLYLPDEGVTTPVEIRAAPPPAAPEAAREEAPEAEAEAEADEAAAGPET